MTKTIYRHYITSVFLFLSIYGSAYADNIFLSKIDNGRGLLNLNDQKFSTGFRQGFDFHPTTPDDSPVGVSKQLDKYKASEAAFDCTRRAITYKRKNETSEYSQGYVKDCNIKSIDTNIALQKIRNRLIYIESYQCTGFLYDTGKIITARHCTDKSLNNNALLLTSADKNKYSIDSKDYKITNACDDKSIRQNCDIATISINSGLFENFTRYQSIDREKLNSLSAGNDIIVSGYIKALAISNNNKIVLGFTDSPMSTIYQIEKTDANIRCIEHGAQTSYGSSGSPIFINVNGEYLFSGIHTGYMRRDETNHSDQINGICNLASHDTTKSGGTYFTNIGLIFSLPN